MSGTFDLEDLSNMDISENDIIAQSKLADQKIALLQKQITLMEQRAKLENLTQRTIGDGNKASARQNDMNVFNMGRYSERGKRNESMDDQDGNVNDQSINLKRVVQDSGRVNRDTNEHVEEIDIVDNCQIGRAHV